MFGVSLHRHSHYFHVTLAFLNFLHFCAPLLQPCLQACTFDLTPRGSASVEEFRRALDEVLESAEEGREPSWLAVALGRGSTERFGLGATAGGR